MHQPTVNGNESRISLWLRVREFAVPPTMIETATARRNVGDWAGACAAAGFDVDVNPRSLARTHGAELARRVRDDLRHLAPDLLRWHMPRVGPDGLLRPALTMTLARYGGHEYGSHCGRAGSIHLVVRTAPAWADAGQRIVLALWDESRPEAGAGLDPHPRPDRRFRLDLHRHLWDARRAAELGIRSRATQFDQWTAEAEILLRAEGRSAGPLAIRLGGRRLIAELRTDASHQPRLRVVKGYPPGEKSALPVLPDAATRVLPDLELLRAGTLTPDRLHPLVASALAPDYPHIESPCGTSRGDQPHLVDCRGERHRIGLLDGVLTALDHDPLEIRREELLAALTGTPLPCLQAIDRAHRHPDCLVGVRERLRHGDIAGALAVVEGLLGPGAALRDGALRDELEAAARKRITYGLFRAGLFDEGPDTPRRRRPPHRAAPHQVFRAHPRHASTR
ncbi:hypothetical protein JMUB6875_69340 [Nocardia sp. JMUB6875]|uniref:hypothetical protein n=1 Tax=Nocardia sp. JMUB6875 TaxID=3158170 RepID=UPI0032E61D5F